MIFPERFLVAGTGTDVGKTLVSAVLTLGLNGHYFKPFQTGSDLGSDRAWVQEKTGLPDSHFSPDGISLKAPLSPDQAAALQGVQIDPQQIDLPSARPLIIEGSGGLLVPLNQDSLLLDWAQSHRLPVLLVAHSGLGTINHSLLSISELMRRRMELIGLVLNGELNRANKESIERHSGVPVLAEFTPQVRLDRSCLLTLYQQFETRP